MRRVAFLSDVHSNLEALDAVLGELHGEEVVCLGDIVGYGPDPNEVIQQLRERRAIAVLGNHDNAALTGDTSWFNSRAAMAVGWTQARLTEESRSYLRTLPLHVRIEFEGVLTYLTHGSPNDNLREYVDPSTHSDLFDYYLAKLGVRLIGLGHTHVPFLWEGEAGTVFNPGSVGQPRDLDPRASYAVVTFEDAGAEVEPRRVGYDCTLTAQKIAQAGLPDSLGKRLLEGR